MFRTNRWFAFFIWFLYAGITGISAQQLQEGFYSFSFQRETVNLTMAETYTAMGIDFYSASIEKYENVIVEYRNGEFVDPTLMVELQRDGRGSLSSELTNFNGTWQGNQIEWQGEKDHFGSQVRISTQGSMEFLSASSLAPAHWNGNYLVREPSSGRELAVALSNGYLRFEPVVRTPLDEQFSGWPVAVMSDGTFFSGQELQVITEMSYVVDPATGERGTNHAESANAYELRGRIDPLGNLEIQFFQADGTRNDASFHDAPMIFSGLAMSDAQMENLALRPPGNLFAGGAANPNASVDFQPSQLELPEWFLIPPPPMGGLAYSAKRVSPQEDQALRAAETMAVAGLSFQIQSQLQNEFSHRYQGNEAQGREFFQQLSQEISMTRLDYQVSHSFYDQANGIAYVAVTMTAEAKERALDALR